MILHFLGWGFLKNIKYFNDFFQPERAESYHINYLYLLISIKAEYD